MGVFHLAFRYSAVSLGIALAGCAVKQIPKEQLHKYALVVPQDLYGLGAAVTEVYSDSQRTSLMMSSEGSNVLPGVSTRVGINVEPGPHRIQVTVCRGTGAYCSPDNYEFEALAGKLYVLSGVGQRITILDRFTKAPQGHLNPFGYSYITDQELMIKRNQELLAVGEADRKINERRKRDQVLIRKIGAHVCKQYSGGVIYSGYVEGITDNKVRINIADAYFKDNFGNRPKGFSPSTIWDSPMNWDLCE